MVGALTSIINQALREGLPQEWMVSKVAPVHKAGNRDEPANYRMIMVSSLFAKLLAGVVEKKLTKWAEEAGVRAIGQAGFRPAHSTTDHIFTLRVLMEASRNARQDLYCCFVDFKTAYDTVPRDMLWQRLQELQVPQELQNVVHQLYDGIYAALPYEDQRVASTMGVKQGCPLSPTLFGLYIDSLETWMQHHGGDGVQLPDATSVRQLLYADDVDLLAHTTSSMQQHLDALSGFCGATGMTVNLHKTKLLAIPSSHHPIPELYYRGQAVEVVRGFKYLGIDFTTNMLWDECVERRASAGWKALYAVQNTCCRIDLSDWARRAHLFRALVEPVLLYGAEVWGPAICKNTWDRLERVQKAFLTYSLGVKDTVPYQILLYETGFWPLQHSAMRRHLAYFHKVDGMDEHRLPPQAVLLTQGPQRLKRVWHEHCKGWFRRWSMDYQQMVALTDLDAQNGQLNACYAATLWDASTLAKPKTEHYHTQINPGLEHGPHQYLKAHISVKKRRAIAAIRTGSHHLRIETGRWGVNGGHSIPREERICQCCAMHVVEDEHHALQRCPAYATVRSAHADLRCSDTPLHQLLASPMVARLGAYILQISATRLALLGHGI